MHRGGATPGRWKPYSEIRIELPPWRHLDGELGHTSVLLEPAISDPALQVPKGPLYQYNLRKPFPITKHSHTTLGI
jgi:hypothetical protein